MILKWFYNCVNMVPNGPFPPSPSPASAKVSCQGSKNIKKIIFLMIFYDFYWKIKKHLLPGGVKSQKINHLLRNDDLFTENMKTESRARHGGADCAPMPGGPWAQYIDRSAPCLPARQVRARWQQEVLGLCFLVVCRMFVFCRMLDARGNLSLRRNSLPLPALQALGPVRSHSFGTLHFCIIFRYVLLYRFFMYCWWIPTSILAPCWHHFLFCLHYFFEHRFYMDLP